MQVLQQATNSATSVLGSTSGKNTWRMPTVLALPNHALSSSLTRPPRPVGQPRPEVQPGYSKEPGDLQAGTIFGNGEREFPDHQRRDQREDHAVHAVKAPAERVGAGDMPMRFGEYFALGDGAIIGV